MSAAPFSKPALTEVTAFLARHQALIVHFSGAPKGQGRDIYFPDDLRLALKGEAGTGLSCSVVRPGDEFEHPHRANAIGCIGVILAANSSDSLVAVSPDDVGSRLIDGVRLAIETDIMPADLESSITNRGRNERTWYNEWVVRDFRVIGLFAIEPLRISVSGEEPDGGWGDTPEYLREDVGHKITSIEIADLERYFPDTPIWSFEDDQLVRVDGGRSQPAKHADLYP